MEGGGGRSNPKTHHQLVACKKAVYRNSGAKVDNKNTEAIDGFSTFLLQKFDDLLSDSVTYNALLYISPCAAYDKI